MSVARQELKRDPIISIGMPVYNGEKFIREALDSLLAQTFTDFELIISDNASIDATPLICREFETRDTRVRYFRQSENLGAAANFQIVLNQERGSYFIWAACDDKWSSDWLQSLYNELLETGTGMAFGEIVHIDIDGMPLAHPANFARFNYTGNVLTRRVKFYLEHEALGKANVIGCLYNKSLCNGLAAMLSECISGECKYDFTLVYNSLKSSELVQARGGVMYKRVHGGSEGAQHGAKMADILLVSMYIRRGIWPLLPGIIGDYVRHSTYFERIILLLLLPVKLLGAYRFKLYKFILKLKGST